MLIAIMGDSYAKVQETREEHSLKANMDIMIDYGDFIKDTQDPKNAYLIVVSEENEDSGN